jgi:hypothetical protein
MVQWNSQVREREREATSSYVPVEGGMNLDVTALLQGIIMK